MNKIRLDQLLTRKGLAPSREKAQALILAGQILVNNQPALKPGQLVSVDSDITVKEPFPYVSRSGAKLEEGLQAFGIDVRDKIALDIGSSTGGFTDCLLQSGARKVYAVDVNIKQLDWKLRQDSRVVPLEKNARYLRPEDLAEKPDLAVIDVSFISVLKILPAIRKIITSGDLLVLIKPQFEADRNQVGKKGIIRDSLVHRDVLQKVLAGVRANGFAVKDLLACQTLGQKGNQEFLAWLAAGGEGLSPEDISNKIQEILANGPQKKN